MIPVSNPKKCSIPFVAAMRNQGQRSLRGGKTEQERGQTEPVAVHRRDGISSALKGIRLRSVGTHLTTYWGTRAVDVSECAGRVRRVG